MLASPRVIMAGIWARWRRDTLLETLFILKFIPQ